MINITWYFRGNNDKVKIIHLLKQDSPLKWVFGLNSPRFSVQWMNEVAQCVFPTCAGLSVTERSCSRLTERVQLHLLPIVTGFLVQPYQPLSLGCPSLSLSKFLSSSLLRISSCYPPLSLFLSPAFSSPSSFFFPFSSPYLSLYGKAVNSLTPLPSFLPLSLSRYSFSGCVNSTGTLLTR